MSEEGSIQRLVPVKPVWPKLGGMRGLVGRGQTVGKTVPRGREKAELMSQPKPRWATPVVVSPSWVKMVAPGWAVVGLLGRGHQLQGVALEGEVAGAASEAIEQRLREEGDVVGGGEDAGLTGYAAHAAGGGVVDGAAEEMVEVGIGGGGALVVMLRWERSFGVSGVNSHIRKGAVRGDLCRRSRRRVIVVAQTHTWAAIKGR